MSISAAEGSLRHPKATKKNRLPSVLQLATRGAPEPNINSTEREEAQKIKNTALRSDKWPLPHFGERPRAQPFVRRLDGREPLAPCRRGPAPRVVGGAAARHRRRRGRHGERRPGASGSRPSRRRTNGCARGRSPKCASGPLLLLKASVLIFWAYSRPVEFMLGSGAPRSRCYGARTSGRSP